MDCNKNCYWNFDGLCVCDDEENYEKGNPNENEKCINWLRSDFEQHLNKTYNIVCELAYHSDLEQLEEVKEFMLKQKGRDKEDERIANL